MHGLPFDSVAFVRDGRPVRMTAREFLDMPVAERVLVILERNKLTFYASGQVIDRTLALKRLRTATL
jgi:hypothetical protein